MGRISRLGLIAIVASAVVAAACGDDDKAPPPVELRSPEASVSVGLDPFEIVVRNVAGKEILRTLGGGGDDAYGAPAATRDDGPDDIKVIPGWDGYRPDERPWAHGGQGKIVTKTDTSASFELDARGGAIRVDIAIEGSKITIKTNAAGKPEDGWNKATMAFALPEDEHFFGLGERYASVDHRGFSMYAWAEEGGAGKGERVAPDDQNPFPNGPSMTYFPVPFFLSSEGYAIHLATTYRTETHFGSERKDAWRFAVNTTALETIVYVHDDPLASLDDFTRDTGRPFVPAPWVFGPRRRVSNGQIYGDVEEWRLLRQRHVPTTGLDDAVHFLPARSEVGREDELRGWVERMHAAGYKVMAYNNPYISTSIERARPDLEYGKQHNLLARTPDGAIGETYFVSGEGQTLATIDLTVPEGITWFQDLLRRTLAFGYDGWMHDFGEYVRRPWKFGDGRNGEAVHNEYPVLSARAAYELLTKERPNDFLFFVRAGYTGTQKYVPAVWGGDPEATFDETQGLPAMLRGGLNLGMSGVPLWGSDVTGFKCITEFPNDKEMYLRWAQVGAVSPIMMEQNACANPLGRRTKWKLWDDDETVAVYADMARLHTRLQPYFEVLAREANQRGVPIMRHPFLYHSRDPDAVSAQSSFYLGPSLFTSPVVERGVRVKETWLPPGRWVDLADHVGYDGARRVSIPAPLAKLPLLIKDGGIVPMLDPSIDTLGSTPDPAVITPDKVKDRLDVIVALSAGQSAKITLVDGTELSARRQGGGASSNLPVVTPDQVASCESGCLATTAEGSVDRLRLTTPLVETSAITHGDVVLEAKGPFARRIRWDVLSLR